LWILCGTEKWQESDQGEATSTWIDVGQWAELSEIPVEKPAPIEVELPELEETRPIDAP
jgi:hypothetical protein